MQIFVTLCGVALFGAFAIAARVHFVSGAWPWSTRLVSALSVAGAVGFAFLAGTTTLPTSRLWLAAALFAVSGLVFALAIKASRSQVFNGVFSPTQARDIVRSGPFAYIRHPFYTSYLLYWLSCAVLTLHPALLALLVVMAVVYTVAARREEAIFLGSAMARDYAAYQRQAGMFWPRLTLPSPS